MAGILTYTFLDNSNFFIEGQRPAAVEAGMAMDPYDAIDRRVFDYTWQPDYGKLHTLDSNTISDICTKSERDGSYLETAAGIAREAGALLSHLLQRRIGYEPKGDFDLVTEADRSSERLIVERLRSYFPSHGIVAEEGGGHESSSEFKWYVDPLDGTTNFAHSYPVFNVTLGLERAGKMLCGVVFDPTRRNVLRRACRSLPQQPAHLRFQSRAARKFSRRHRLSLTQTPPQPQHPLLSPTRHEYARCPAGRRGCHRSRLRRLRPPGRLLGIQVWRAVDYSTGWKGRIIPSRDPELTKGVDRVRSVDVFGGLIIGFLIIVLATGWRYYSQPRHPVYAVHPEFEMAYRRHRNKLGNPAEEAKLNPICLPPSMSTPLRFS